MPLTPEERQRIISDLATNSEMWRDEQGRQALQTFSDDKLAGLKVVAERERKAISIANAAVAGFQDGETAYRFNPETGMVERASVANAGGKKKKPAFLEEDEEEDEEDEEDEDEEYAEMMKKKKKRMAGNSSTQRRPATMDEFISSAPPGIREQFETTFRVAQQVEQREKDKLIGQIIGNVAEPERRAAMAEWLQTEPLDKLANMVALIPKAPTAEDARRVNNAARGAQSSFRPLNVDNDMLEIPTVNWETVDGNEPVNNDRSSASIPVDQLSEDEWLRNAPPAIRQSVQNAMVLESRERAQLIDQLVANVIDEDKEKALRKRLEKKPLDELRDMLTLVPSKPASPVRTNFFGPPAVGGAPVINDSQSDVLPIPSVDWSQESKRRA